MLSRVICVGAALLAGIVRAEAETPEASTPQASGVVAPRLASVDANGHIKLRDQLQQSFDVVGHAATGDLEPPCPAAKALSVAKAQALVQRIAAQEGFDPALALSVARVGSRYVSTVVSPNGAYGLMQLMPDTALQLRVDVCDPPSNVRGGIRYLSTLEARYQNPIFALAAYIAGEDAVEKSHGVPADAETLRFIADVLNDAAHKADQARLSSGEAQDLPAPDRIPPSPSPGTTKPAASPDWSDGFVMHVQ